MLKINGSERRTRLRLQQPDPRHDLTTPSLHMCRDTYFCDAGVHCELPAGHPGVHEVHLFRRRIQWSVLGPDRA